jgi:hypothetical protein
MPTVDAEPPARLTIHRTSARDEQSRQVLCSVDGDYVGQLLYGQTLTREIPAGPHTLSVNNTLFWRKVTIAARPGEHVQFTVWNQPFGGNVMRLLFLFVGAAPLKLGFAEGPPDPAASPPT